MDTLLITCDRCGLRKKDVSDLFKLVKDANGNERPMIPLTARMGDVFGRLRCQCGRKPVGLRVEAAWVRKYGVTDPPSEDLTHLLDQNEEAAKAA